MTTRGVEHEEKPRRHNGEVPTQRDPSERYADDPEFEHDDAEIPREEDDE